MLHPSCRRGGCVFLRLVSRLRFLRTSPLIPRSAFSCKLIIRSCVLFTGKFPNVVFFFVNSGLSFIISSVRPRTTGIGCNCPSPINRLINQSVNHYEITSVVSNQSLNQSIINRSSQKRYNHEIIPVRQYALRSIKHRVSMTLVHRAGGQPRQYA